MTTESDNERIARLLTEATPSAAGQLRDLAETTGDKEARKAARRALYLLSQRRITPPERPAQVERQPISSRVAAAVKAYASAYDGAGNRAIYLLFPGSDGGNPTFVQYMINDEQGITDAGAQKVSRREMADLARTLENQLDQGVAFAEIESDYALHLLIMARAINQGLRTPTPTGALEWMLRLGMPEGDYSRPPVYNRLSVAELEADPDLPRDPHELFFLSWFDPWFLEVEQVTPWLERLLTPMDSSLELSDETRREQAEQATGEAVDALVVGATRTRYIHRLEETADILLRRGLDQDAKQALYHAQALSSDRPASQIPFATRLVERTITVALTMRMQEA